MLKHCFVVLFLVLRARCTSVLQPPAPEDGSGSGGRALQLQFILQNSAELREEAECRNSELNFCIQGPLVQLVELQDTINVTLGNQSMAKVDGVLTELAVINTSVQEVAISIHLLSSNLSQINSSLIWSEKLFISAQENTLTLEQLLTEEFRRASREIDKIQSIAAMTTLVLKKASASQEDAIVLLEMINMTIFELVATRTQVQCGLSVLNTSSLRDGDGAFSSVTELVNASLSDATMALRLSEQYHCEAAHTLTNLTALLNLLDAINRSLIGITELEAAVDTSNSSNILTEAMGTLVALMQKLEVAQSLNQSVAEGIYSAETSLASAFTSAVETENILNELSKLLERVEELSVELGDLNQESMQQLQEHVASVDMMEQHAILLFDQKELLIELAEGSGVLDCPTEFDRLAKTQSIASDSVTLSEKVIQILENTVPAVVEHVAEVEELVTAVTVLVNITKESLPDVLLGISTIIQAIAKHSAELDERKNSLRVVNRTVDQTSTVIKQIEMQIELLDMQADNAWRSFFTSSIRTERAKMLGSVVESILEGIPRNVEAAETCINSTVATFGAIELLELEVQNRTGLLNDSLLEVESGLLEMRRIIEEAEQTVQSILRFLNTNNVPLRIEDDIVPAMDLNLNATNESQELRSVSLTVELEEVQDSVLLHLTNLLESVDLNTSLTVGVLNGSLVAAFVQAHPALTVETDVVELTISETSIQPFTEYKIDATRTARNTHLLLTEMETGTVYSASATSSSRISFYFRVGFLQNAELYVGGALRDTNVENTPFFAARNSTGCVNRVNVNGIRVNLWNTITLKTGVQPCTNSSLGLAGPLQLSLNGQQYSRDLLEDGNIFPTHLSFRTLLPNGWLLLARNSDQATSLEVVLQRGRIVVRVRAGSRSRTLTSSQLYNNGSSEAATITLTASQRGLVLLTELEETRRGLINIATDEVMNYTEVFIGGTPQLQEIESQLELSNFTGCTRVLWPAKPISEIPMCVMDKETRPCLYCTDQAVLSAAFYGASYAEFPSISIGDSFDLSFNLKTAFGDGLIAFAGNGSKGIWIAVLLTNSQASLIFRSGSSGISLPIRSAPLDDDEWHEVTIVRDRSDLNFLVDGISAGGNPFGGLLPSGSLGTNLYIGGISPESENLLPFGISSEGFKGCLDGVRVLGKPLDFSTNLGLGAVALGVCSRTSGNEDQDVYTFAGSAFATYDLGRFGSNFSVGFQFRTNCSTGLLLLTFSRKTVDALAVQVVDGKIQFYIRSELVEVLVTADIVISDGQWHTARVEKSGRRLRVVVDGVEGMDSGAPEEELRTNSLLYIGGVPDDIRVPLPESVTSQSFIGCLRISFLSQSLLTNVLADQCQLFSVG